MSAMRADVNMMSEDMPATDFNATACFASTFVAAVIRERDACSKKTCTSKQ
jgi:hypothetical protein